MLGKWQDGYQVVQALRRDRSMDSWTKRTTPVLLRIMSKINRYPDRAKRRRLPPNGPRVVDALLSFPERNRS